MNIKYECYFGNIPEMFKLKLVELYDSPYCTFEHTKYFHGDSVLNYFIIYNDEELIHIITFIIDKQYKTVNILNRLFFIDIKYLNLFLDFVFNSEFQIDKIHVDHLINQTFQDNNFPAVFFPYDEDYVIKLPDSNTEYLSCLSPNMRRHSKNYISKIKRSFNSYSFKVFEKEDVDLHLINKIIEMNHLRMSVKNIVSGIDKSYADKIIKFVRDYGFVSVLEIDGEVVAGLISYSIKNNYYVEEISNYPQYDAFNVGHTCLFLTIQNCIDRKGNEFHLLFGNSPYKQRFLAERFQLYSVTVFRTSSIKFKYLIINKIFKYASLKYFKTLIKKTIKKIIGYSK